MQLKIYSSGYNDLTHLRAAITSIPFIGSQLDLYLSTPGQKFVEERLEYLINELQIQLNEIQESSIDKKLFNSDEGYDLINKTFIIAAKTRQKEKLNQLAQILRGAFTIKYIYHDPELYLKIVDELSVREINVAFLLYDVKIVRKIQTYVKEDNSRYMGKDTEWFSKNYPQYAVEELQYIFSRLEGAGLIKEETGMMIGYIGEQYNSTQLLSDFINYVNHNK